MQSYLPIFKVAGDQMQSCLAIFKVAGDQMLYLTFDPMNSVSGEAGRTACKHHRNASKLIRTACKPSRFRYYPDRTPF